MFLLQFLAYQKKNIYSISSIVETSDLGERILEATRSRAESTQWNHHKCRKNATWIDRSMGTSEFCAFVYTRECFERSLHPSLSCVFLLKRKFLWVIRFDGRNQSLQVTQDVEAMGCCNNKRRSIPKRKEGTNCSAKGRNYLHSKKAVHGTDEEG
jgi:hypothetical protein